MRCLSIVLLSAMLFASPGCMYCENGLCSPGESEASFDPALVGEWEPVDPKPESKGYYKVERDDPGSKAYRITAFTVPEDSKPIPEPGGIKAYLARLGDSLFLDAIMPPDRGDEDQSPRHFILIADIKKSEIGLRILDLDFIRDHPDSISCVVPLSSRESQQFKGFDLRLMFSANDASGLPTAGKKLIIVAVVGQVIHFRIFDDAGKMIMDVDAKKLTERTRPIEDLGKQLESLRPHEITEGEKARVIATVTSIARDARFKIKVTASTAELRGDLEI